MTSRRPPSGAYSGGVRALDGMTVFAESEHGEQDALVRSCMPQRGALLSIARELDERPARWRVVCISSPSTILGDLRGREHEHGYGDTTQLSVPEARMLGAIGRLDLLEL